MDTNLTQLANNAQAAAGAAQSAYMAIITLIGAAAALLATLGRIIKAMKDGHGFWTGIVSAFAGSSSVPDKPAQNSSRFSAWLIVGGLAGVLAMTGCARVHSKTKTYTPVVVGTNVTYVLAGETELSGYSMFDANLALQKASNQSEWSGTTNNRFAPGTRLSGVSAESNTTNLAQTVRIVVETAAPIAKGAAGVP